MRKILFYTILILLSMPLVSMAEDKYTLLEPLPCIQGTGNNCAASTTISEISLDTYIGYIFKFAIAISAFLAVLMIIWGGFEIMLSEAIPAKMEGKSRVYNALIGLLMVLSSYLILRTIDPRLVEINTSLPQIKVDKKNMAQELEAYEKALTTDISNLSTMDSNNAKIATKKQASAEALLSEIDSQLNNSTNPPSAEEMVTLRQRAEELKEEIKKINLEKNVSEAQASGLSNLKGVLNVLYNPDTSSTATNNIDQWVSTGNDNPLRSSYEEAIAKARATNNTEQAVMLQKQRDFFLAQVIKEKNIKDRIDLDGKRGYEPVGLYGTRPTTINSKPQLRADKAEAEAELVNSKQIEGTGVNKALYENILNLRIERINAALEKK